MGGRHWRGHLLYKLFCTGVGVREFPGEVSDYEAEDDLWPGAVSRAGPEDPPADCQVGRGRQQAGEGQGAVPGGGGRTPTVGEGPGAGCAFGKWPVQDTDQKDSLWHCLRMPISSGLSSGTD